MQERNDAPEMPRREFLRRVGAAGLAVSIVGADALAAKAAAPAPAVPPAAAPAKPDSAAAAPPVPGPPSDDALALTGILKRRFPQRLTPEQWDGVTKSLDQRLDSGRRLRATKLANGDEPDSTFRA
jgi:hypothetical protein